MRPAVGIILLYALSIVGFWLVARAGGPEITPCVFLNVTGQPCFLCGGTRAAWAWGTGDWVAAFVLNPLAALAFTVALFAVAFRLIRGRFPRIRQPDRRVAWTVAILAVALNWWWVWTHLPR